MGHLYCPVYEKGNIVREGAERVQEPEEREAG